MSFVLPLVLTVIGFLYRWAFRNEPYRWDEAYTYLAYASKPFSDFWARYDFPNNHVFHTLLVHLSTQSLGFTPLGLRLPVLLAGTGLIASTYWCAWRLLSAEDRSGAWIPAAWVALSPWLTYYSVNARGYVVQAFLATIIVGLYHRPTPVSARPNRTAAIVSLLSALILWTAPTGLLVVFPFFLYMAWRAKRSDGALPWAWLGVSALLTLMLYGVLAWPALRSMTGLWHASLQDSQWIAENLAEWGRDMVRGIMPGSLFAALLIVGIYSFWTSAETESRQRSVLFLFLGVLPAASFVLGNRVPGAYARCYVPLVPFAYICASQGLIRLCTRSFNGRGRRVAVGLAAVLFVAYSLADVTRTLRHPEALFFPERGPSIQIRDLTRRLSAALWPGDRIQGAGLSGLADTVAAAYTVETRGFQGFYGIRGLYREVNRIFLVALSETDAMSFYNQWLDHRFWTTPRALPKGGWKTTRLRSEGTLPSDLRGFRD